MSQFRAFACRACSGTGQVQTYSEGGPSWDACDVCAPEDFRDGPIVLDEAASIRFREIMDRPKESE